MVGGKILFVDDEQDIRRLLGLRLRSSGSRGSPVGAGADAFFHKPFDHDDLLGAIARALGRPA